MRKVVVGEFVSLDGVTEAPETWHMRFMDGDMMEFLQESFAASDALLLGRVTYEEFAAAFGSGPAANSPFAQMMNARPKYVASTTLQEVTWNNSTLIGGNLAEAVHRLKQQPGKNIAVSGSGTLVQSLLEQNLVDELHLLVHPVVVGRGKRLFQSVAPRTLQLVKSQTFGSGVVALTYASAV